jgi:signal transduction histidine kinase
MKHPVRRPGLRWWRSSIRTRLTLLYAGAFFLASAILVAALYLVVGHALGHQLTARIASVEQLRTHPAHDVSPELVEQLRAQYQQDHDTTMRMVLGASLVSLAVLGVAAAGSGWLLAGRALRPLQDITATARRIADHSLHERISLAGPADEIKDLADTLDAMLERLDRAFDSQRRFVANASHELRTPLTINRTLIEVALDDPHAGPALRQLGANLLAVNHRHERLIDGLLTLASSQERLTTHVPADLAAIAVRVAADLRAATPRAGVDIRTALAPAPVAGDPVLLERLVHNLIDNAIRYNTPEGGWVQVTTSFDDAAARLSVENPGPPIPPHEVAGLFEPFRRLATDRAATGNGGQGAGLGLSIVQSIAHAHSGDVHATARPDGGLTVHVRLPTISDSEGREGATEIERQRGQDSG